MHELCRYFYRETICKIFTYKDNQNKEKNNNFRIMKIFQFGHLKFQGKIPNCVVNFKILALYFATISSGLKFCVSQKAHKHQILVLKLF